MCATASPARSSPRATLPGWPSAAMARLLAAILGQAARLGLGGWAWALDHLSRPAGYARLRRRWAAAARCGRGDAGRRRRVNAVMGRGPGPGSRSSCWPTPRRRRSPRRSPAPSPRPATNRRLADRRIPLSDDASPDGTFAVMQAMAAAYAGPHRVVLNRNARNRGLIGHLNRVMELAGGRLRGTERRRRRVAARPGGDARRGPGRRPGGACGTFGSATARGHGRAEPLGRRWLPMAGSAQPRLSPTAAAAGGGT